jgi:hypothetical protein
MGRGAGYAGGGRSAGSVTPDAPESDFRQSGGGGVITTGIGTGAGIRIVPPPGSAAGAAPPTGIKVAFVPIESPGGGFVSPPPRSRGQETVGSTIGGALDTRTGGSSPGIAPVFWA